MSNTLNLWFDCRDQLTPITCCNCCETQDLYLDTGSGENICRDCATKEHIEVE